MAEIIYKSTREAFGETLNSLASKNSKIFAVTADLSESLKLNKFKENFPSRFVQVGVAEQNMAGVSAGLSFEGKIPFMCSFAVFSPGRNWDQVRVSICYSKANVKIIGGHIGLTNSGDGATHMGLEDIAITRVLPNLTVFSPADANQTARIIEEAVSIDGPVYIRLGRNEWPNFTTNENFQIGIPEIIKNGEDLTIVTTGQMLYKSMQATEELAKSGIKAEIINVHTIKPLTPEVIIKSVQKTKKLLVVEEHQKYGGLLSAILEKINTFSDLKVAHIAINDTFAESGELEKLYEKYGLTTENIIYISKKLLNYED